MPGRAKTLRAPEISLHFDDPPTESSYNLPHSQEKHGLASLADRFTCFPALNRMFSCPLDCLSLLILLHSTSINLSFSPIQAEWGRFFLIAATLARHFYFLPGLTCTTVFVDPVTHPSWFLEGGVQVGLSPICLDLHRSVPHWLHYGHSSYISANADPRTVPSD